MHMADGLISPAVGGSLIAVTLVVGAYSVKKIKNDITDKKIPLMGVMGAFVFAAQMINFSIPGTGSSGHIGGGILLAVLLGPFAGFLTMAIILFIQAILFGDGGLLAFGCNVINLGFYSCFIGYILLFKPIIKNGFSNKRILFASIISVIVALQLGSISVVFETLLSGKTELPFSSFLLYMQSIHFGIGLIEGLITASVIIFIWSQRPEILTENIEKKKKSLSNKKIILIVFISMIVIAGGVSLYASEYPDGLEWSILKVDGVIHEKLSEVQEKTAVLKDYDLKSGNGTSLAGIIGGVGTFIIVFVFGFLIKIFKRKKRV